MPDPRTTLDRLARALPGVDSWVACEGTKIESTAYAVGKKPFLHVGKAEPIVVRFKLADGGAARRQGVEVGTGGWCKLLVTGPLPKDIAAWVAESHGLAAAPARRLARARRGR